MNVPDRTAPLRQRPHRRPALPAALVLGTAALCAGTGANASTGNPAPPATATFDPIAEETQVHERIAADLCVSFRLAQEWKPVRSAPATLLEAAHSDDDLEIRLRSADDLAGFPQADTAGREAAALQQSYEALIGKPAQAVAFQPTGRAGVTRWSATWIDANLASSTRSLTVETFIVGLKGGSALELTLTNAGTGDDYRVQVARLLSSLQVRSGGPCQGEDPARR